MKQPVALLISITILLCFLVLGAGTPGNGFGSLWRIERRPAIAAVGEALQLNEQAVPMVNPPAPDWPALTVLPTPVMPQAPQLDQGPIRGVYATGYSAGSAKKLTQILAFIKKTEVNALVVDIKDDSGLISYRSSVPMVKELKSDSGKFVPANLLSLLKQENVYPIARIVVFQDPYLASHRTDLAVRSKAGGLWKDRKGQLWVDPHNKAVWRYIVDIAKEAAALGFREIQFDYVRFTSDGKLSDCLYPYATGQSKADVIKEFLLYARKELKPTGVKLSADIFGLTCSATDDMGIGQEIEKIATAVDIVSPMVYPSHYYPGTYGIKEPDLAPYETISASLKAAKARLAGTGICMRPWLQDFSLKHHYGREQLLAQIKAVYDNGYTEWIFWNPTNTYQTANYNTQ